MRSPVKCGESVLFFIGGVIIEYVFGVDEVFLGGQLKWLLGGEGCYECLPFPLDGRMRGCSLGRVKYQRLCL